MRPGLTKRRYKPKECSEKQKFTEPAKNGMKMEAWGEKKHETASWGGQNTYMVDERRPTPRAQVDRAVRSMRRLMMGMDPGMLSSSSLTRRVPAIRKRGRDQSRVTEPFPWKRATGLTELRNEMAIKGCPNMLKRGRMGVMGASLRGVPGVAVWHAPCLDALVKS